MKESYLKLGGLRKGLDLSEQWELGDRVCEAVGSAFGPGTQTLRGRLLGREIECEVGEARMSWNPGFSWCPQTSLG